LHQFDSDASHARRPSCPSCLYHWCQHSLRPVRLSIMINKAYVHPILVCLIHLCQCIHDSSQTKPVPTNSLQRADCATSCTSSASCLSRTVPMLAGAKHTLRPPVGQLTSARRLAASCAPALVARTITIQLNLLITVHSHRCPLLTSSIATVSRTPRALLSWTAWPDRSS
jgi:hypothetical protein